MQLRHIPTGIVVKSQATRSRSENRAIARGLLAARLDEIRNPDTCRTAAIAEKKMKKRANATKKARRKYKKLAGTNEEEEDEENEEGEGGNSSGQLADEHRGAADTPKQEHGTEPAQQDKSDATVVTR